MTTSGTERSRGRRLPSAGALALLIALTAPAGRAEAGSPVQPDIARPDSSAGTLTVETLPAGLAVRVDDVDVGRAPVGPIWIHPRIVRVRAVAEDPRRFDPATDAVSVAITPGTHARILLDLRRSIVLRTEPEAARVLRWTDAAPESLLGEAPLRLKPALLERARLRLESPHHADSLVEGGAILALAGDADMVHIALRRVAPPPPPLSRTRPLLRRRWLQWTLVGTGAACSAAAVIFKREGDRWYDRYLESSDRRVLDTYFRRAEHYDRLAVASLAVGQTLFTGGLVLLLSGPAR